MARTTTSSISTNSRNHKNAPSFPQEDPRKKQKLSRKTLTNNGDVGLEAEDSQHEEDQVNEEEARQEGNYAGALKVAKGRAPGSGLGVNLTLCPMHALTHIFEHLTASAFQLGLKDVFVEILKGRKLKIATMCSGTESPILACRMLSNGEFLHHSYLPK